MIIFDNFILYQKLDLSFSTKIIATRYLDSKQCIYKFESSLYNHLHIQILYEPRDGFNLSFISLTQIKTVIQIR
jgi:hypothetical protein